MFIQNLKHELRLLSRSYWFLTLAILFIVLCLYAGYNGARLYEFRMAEIEQAEADQRSLTDRVTKIAQAMKNGESPDNAFRVSPINYSIAAGTLATLKTDPLSVLAVGQSDLYTHQVKISAREDLATLTFTEMSNPVQLLFGNFDLVFVLTYLIPLIIIAFTYNLQSQELESGRLSLIASNPIDPKLWLLQRYMTRFLTLSVILGAGLIITFLVFHISFSLKLGSMVILTLGYMFFWFALSFLVNAMGYSSAKNAILLLSLWIILVLIIPAVINQTANSFYPTPSRVVLLNEIRETKNKLSKEQDKVLDEYLRNHPELVRNEEENRFAYWQGFFASQEMMESTLTPLITRFDRQLSEQQKWVNTFRFLSPAILFQTGFTELAGTSARQYHDFKKSVTGFTITWREYFLPMVFGNRMLKSEDLASLPAFDHIISYDRSLIFTNGTLLLAISGMLLIPGFRKTGSPIKL